MKRYSRAYYEKFIHSSNITPAVTLIMDSLELRKSDRVLDIGCGIGRFTYMLSKYSENVVGMDYSETAIQIAIEKYPKNRFVQGNATRIPFRDNEFDKCICTHVLEHIINYEEAIREIYRVTKQGATIIFITPNKTHIVKNIPYIKRYLADETHVKEFTKTEFQMILSRYFVIKKIKFTSMIVNFAPFNKILNFLLNPDIFVYTIKE